MTTSRHRAAPRISRELLIALTLTALATVIERRFDLFDRLIGEARKSNAEVVNEVVSIAAILAIVGLGFTWRQWRALHRENRERQAVERALRHSEEQYRSLFAGAHDPMLIFSPATRCILLANDGAADLYGVPREALIGHSLHEFSTNFDYGIARANELLAHADVSPRGVDTFVHQRADGTLIDILAHASVVTYEGETAILTINRNVTEQRRAEAALLQQNAYYAALHETSLGLLHQLDPTAVLEAIVERAVALVGTEHGYVELITDDGQHLETVVTIGMSQAHHGARKRRGEGLGGAIWQTGQPLAINDYSEWQGRMHDGEPDPPFAVVGVPLTSGDTVIGVLGIVSREAGRMFGDAEVELLTRFASLASVALHNARLHTAARQELEERRRADARLGASETRFRALIEQSSEGILLVGPDATIQYASPSTVRILGYRPDEFIGHETWELIHPDDRQEAIRMLTEIVAQGRGAGASFEYRMRHKDGTDRWLESFGTNLLDDPAVGAIVVNYREVTERKAIEAALRESEERYRRLVEQSPDAIAVHSESRYVYVNDAAVRLFGGQRPEDLLGRSIYDFVPEGEREVVKWRIQAAAANADTPPLVESKRQRLDGAIRDMESIGIPITYQGKHATHVVYRDVTERKAAEETLRRQHTYLEALHETSLGLLNRLDIAELLEAILSQASVLLGAPDGFIYWLKDGNAELPTRVGIGIFRDDVANPVRRGEGVTGIVWETGEPLVVSDYQQWPHRRAGGKRDQIHAAVAVPLRVDQQVVGVISLAFLTPERVVRDDEVELLLRFAHLASIALDNARLYSQMRQELHEREQAEAQMRESEERYRTLTELSPEPIVVHARGRYIFANAAALKLLGAAQPDQVIGKPVFNFIHPSSRTLARRRIRRSYTEHESSGMTEVTMVRVNGEAVEVETDNMPITDHDGPATIVVFHDITERKEAERQLRESEERYRLLFDSNPMPMWVYDTDSLRFLAVNDAAIGHYGYTRDEFLAMTTPDIRPPDEIPALRDFLATHTERYQPSGIWRHRKKDGTLVDMEITSYWLEFEGCPARLVVANDVTERQRAEEALRHHALHDALTGLPNRTLFAERLARALERAKRNADYRFAVLYLDFDRFKTINDSLGHLEGDHVLIEGARRLAQCVRPQDTLARLGGDEFVVLLEELTDRDDPIQTARCLSTALAAPIALRGQEVVIAASIGIVLGAPQYHRPDELLRDADIAMYQAKAQGKGEPVIFDGMMHARAVARLHMENELRRAVEQKEFLLYYQPIVVLTSGETTGFEALVRWRHPEIGIIVPDDFIPLAEETGLIVPLGQWVLREACRQLCQWDDGGPTSAHFTMSVNVSARELRQPDFVARVLSVLRETGLAPERLVLEITESVLIEETQAVGVSLAALHEAGVRIHLDDFGMGYSSLSYLHRFPMDALKIDRSFVSGSGDTGVANRGIVEAIVGLARTLGIAVTAEGVETAEQEAELRMLACEYGQGYLFSAPITSEKVASHMHEWTGVPASSDHRDPVLADD